MLNNEKLDTLILIGEVRFGKIIKKEQIQEALDYYKRIGVKEKFEKIGYLAIENGYILIALDAFKLAEVVLPEKELMILADRYLESPYVLEIYKALGKTDKLIEIGRSYLGEGKLSEASDFYNAAGVKISEELVLEKIDEYITEGNYLSKEGFYSEAIKVYEILGAKDDLFAMLVSTNGSLSKYLFKRFLKTLEAILEKPLKDALSPEEIKIITDYGDQYFELGHYDEGEIAYKAIGEKMPADKLIACGNKLLFGLDLGTFFGLLPIDIFPKGYNALRKAGLTPSRGKIIEAGDNYLKCSSVAQAIKAYEKAGAEDRLCKLLKKEIGKEYDVQFLIEDIAQAIIRVRNKKNKWNCFQVIF